MPTAAPESFDVAGLILAGGRGQRMGGVDKGWTHYQGRPLIEWVVERFAPQVGSLLISANRNLERYTQFGTVITDREASDSIEPFAGPLAGLLAGLRATPSTWLAIVPCDAPHLPLDLVATLARECARAEAPAAVARVDSQLQPVFAIVAARMAGVLETAVAQGERAMHRWLRSIDAETVDFPDAAAFRNINVLEGRPG